MYQDVKCINGSLYYEERDGKYYPCSGSGAGGGARGGGGGRGRGIIVQDEGTQVNGFIKTLNFIGDVTVTDAGGGKVDITIPGYVIASLTTVQRIALVPTTALIVEDIDLDMYFKWSTVSNSWSPF